MYDAPSAPEASPFAATAHAAAEAVDAYSWSDDEEALDAYTQAFEDFYTARKAAIEQAYPLTEYYKQVPPPRPNPSHQPPASVTRPRLMPSHDLTNPPPPVLLPQEEKRRIFEDSPSLVSNKSMKSWLRTAEAINGRIAMWACAVVAIRELMDPSLRMSVMMAEAGIPDPTNLFS